MKLGIIAFIDARYWGHR